MTTILFLGGWLPPFPSRRSPGSRASSGSRLRSRSCCSASSWVRGDLPALPLRPADAAGLEGVPAVLAGLAGPDRGRARIHRLAAEVRRRHDVVPRSHRAHLAAGRTRLRHGADAALFLHAQGDASTIPSRKARSARASAASMRCAAIRTARNAASPASCARRSARPRRSPSRPSRATTAAAARRATIST